MEMDSDGAAGGREELDTDMAGGEGVLERLRQGRGKGEEPGDLD